MPENKYPPGLKRVDVIGFGSSGMVARLNAVAKWPLSDAADHIERERHVYERLAPYEHQGLLRYFGELPTGGIILEHAPHNSIRHYIRSSGNDVPYKLRLRWISQIADTFVFLHSKGIYQADISCNNVFLDKDWNAKVADFAGASIDEHEALGCYEYGYDDPRNEDVVSTTSEIFALGSMFYEIMTGTKPYQALEPGDIKNAFQRGEFPSTAPLGTYGSIVERCWTRLYKTTEELAQDVVAAATLVEADGSTFKQRQKSLLELYPILPSAAILLIIAGVWHRLRF